MARRAGTRKPRLVILGDSLGLPRREIPLDETYGALLQDVFPGWRVLGRHFRGNHTGIEVRDRLEDDIRTIVPDVVVIHLGHIDCQPRLYTEREHLVISRLPVRARNVILRLGARVRWRVTRLRRRTYVTLADYRRHLTTICDTARQTNPRVRLIVLGIARSREANERRTYGVDENIRVWNGAAEAVAREQGAAFVDLYRLLDPLTDLLDDGVHLTRRGNRIVCAKVARIVRRSDPRAGLAALS